MLIAECCSNHGGDMELARRMILSAKENGADLVKFQLYDAEDDKDKPHYEWIKKAELSFEQAKMLFDYGAAVGIEVFFSVFRVKYVDWCEKIGVKRYKIASGMRNVLALLAVRYTGKLVIISSRHNRWSVNKFFMMDKKYQDVLYCPVGYPANVEWLPDFNYPEPFDYQGFSDHSIGLDAAKIALACGAQIIEKHFILDREHSLSPEKDWSMIPSELKELKRWETVCQKILG